MPPRRHAVVIGINRYPHIPGADLRGCLNDADLIERLLVERFAFAPCDVRVLRDEEATRRAIRSAFADLQERLDEADVAVVFFAGHGSRMRDPRRPDRFIESLVPHDSGRGPHPNRDLPDWEIDRWMGRLNLRTPHVTLIFDCCHSGAATRDPSGGGIREAPIDDRVATNFGGEDATDFGGKATDFDDADLDGENAAPPPFTDGVPRGPSGWLPGTHRATLLAACRADEFAGEHRLYRGGRVLRHGAFTFFLARQLANATGELTWRAVHSIVAPAVSAVHRHQHPQIEGRADALIFGTREARPAAHLTVTDVDGEAVQIAGGAAHGLLPGSRFAIQPAGAADTEGDELATVRVAEVGATRSRALLEAPSRTELIAGQWAYPRSPAADPQARFHRLLALDNPDPSSRLRGRVELSVHGADGTDCSSFEAGERAEIVLVHHHDGPLFVNLLEFGVDGKIEVLLPRAGHPTYRPGGLPLEPGVALRLAADYYRLDPRFRAEVEGGLVLRPPAAGELFLKLFATTEPADFDLLAQPASRDPQSSPLAEIEDWTAVTVSLKVLA